MKQGVLQHTIRGVPKHTPHFNTNAMADAKKLFNRLSSRFPLRIPRPGGFTLQTLCVPIIAFMVLTRRWLLMLLLAVLVPSGCSTTQNPSTGQAPLIRVKLLTSVDSAMLTTNAPPIVRAASDAAAHTMEFPAGQRVQIILGPDGMWRIGMVPAGSGELWVQPAAGDSLILNGQAYRGVYRLVPVAPGRFDVINDVDIDSYLKGVLSAELLPRWQIEAYKAQAIAARTYALYHAKTDGVNRNFDVYSDTRSQVYGGIGAETDKSRQASDETAGVVLTYGPPGDEHIFETYFSACCGGISQSAYDALGGPNIEPLQAQNVGTLCNASPKFNWGPIVIAKPELTRRIKTWARGRTTRSRTWARSSASTSIW